MNLNVINTKLQNLEISLSKKLNVELPLVQEALEKAIYTLPRLKNYFTKIEKSFKLLVNKQNVLFELINYFLKNPNVEPSNLAYTLKQQYGRSVPDETIIKNLKDTNLEILTTPSRRKTSNDYDFTI